MTMNSLTDHITPRVTTHIPKDLVTTK